MKLKTSNFWNGFVPSLTFDKAGGRSLTIPNQGINISDAITRFSAPAIAERLKGYYEQEGLEMPNFDRLDKIERLQLLAEARETFKIKKQLNNEAQAKAQAKAAEAAEVLNSPIPNQSKTDSK